jgi:hypothetical protein
VSRTPTRAQLSGTLEIRPGPLRQFAVIAGCLLFVGCGVLLVLTGPLFQKVIGLAAGAFFGWALVTAIRRFRSRRAIVLSPSGLRPALGGEMPWDDIEEVGTFKYRHNTLVGIRLSSRERFVASFTEAERRRLARTNAAVRVLGGIFRPDIAADSSLSSVEGTMDFARRNYGCDWTFGALELDRSPREFAALLRERVASARASG